MVVTTSIRLERILLHSRATSISSPGIDSMIPSCVAGTPTARNMIRAADRRLLLQEFDDPAQSELGDGDHQEEKAERKQKRLKSFCSKTQQDGWQSTRSRGQTCRATAGHRPWQSSPTSHNHRSATPEPAAPLRCEGSAADQFGALSNPRISSPGVSNRGVANRGK